MIEDLEVAIKVVVVGNGAVGKSSLIQRYCKNSFSSEYKKTIGVDFMEKQIHVSDVDIRLMVWDTAGQEEFDSITKAYYRGAHVCIIVFSCVDRNSFLALESWMKKVEDEVGGIVMCVVQNKVDMIEGATMTHDEVEEVIKDLKLKLFRTSVKENFNVDKVFEYLSAKYLDRRRREVHARSRDAIQGGHIGGAYDIDITPMKQSFPTNASSNTRQSESFQILPSRSRAKNKMMSCIIL